MDSCTYERFQKYYQMHIFFIKYENYFKNIYEICVLYYKCIVNRRDQPDELYTFSWDIILLLATLLHAVTCSTCNEFQYNIKTKIKIHFNLLFLTNQTIWCSAFLRCYFPSVSHTQWSSATMRQEYNSLFSIYDWIR